MKRVLVKKYEDSPRMPAELAAEILSAFKHRRESVQAWQCNNCNKVIIRYVDDEGDVSEAIAGDDCETGMMQKVDLGDIEQFCRSSLNA